MRSYTHFEDAPGLMSFTPFDAIRFGELVKPGVQNGLLRQPRIIIGRA
jgi:hypothetical protein